jgi:hypothetical protein
MLLTFSWIMTLKGMTPDISLQEESLLQNDSAMEVILPGAGGSVAGHPV